MLTLMPEGSRLDALLGTGFAVIMTAQFTAQQREQLHQRGAVALTVDAASELGRWLRHGRATAAMIRPDRTVMEAGRRVSSLCDAVPRFTPAVNAERTGSC